MPSPADKLFDGLSTLNARKILTAAKEERRKLLRPFVAAEASKHAPAKTGPKIITRLLRGKDFRERFSARVSRRTLDADATALLEEFAQT